MWLKKKKPKQTEQLKEAIYSYNLFCFFMALTDAKELSIYYNNDRVCTCILSRKQTLNKKYFISNLLCDYNYIIDYNQWKVK